MCAHRSYHTVQVQVDSHSQAAREPLARAPTLARAYESLVCGSRSTYKLLAHMQLTITRQPGKMIATYDSGYCLDNHTRHFAENTQEPCARRQSLTMRSYTSRNRVTHLHVRASHKWLACHLQVTVNLHVNLALKNMVTSSYASRTNTFTFLH